MFEKTEKKLRELGKDDVGIELPITTKTREEQSTASLQPDTVPDVEFMQFLKERVDEEGIVEVFKKDDGTFSVNPVTVIDKWLLYSLCANAVLLVLFISKVIGMW
jgi:hypothetical protein